MSMPPYQPPEQPWSQGSPEPPPTSYGHPGQYGYPPYGGTIEHPQGMVILILGILSLTVCGLLGPVAWIMGNNALAEIDRNPRAYSNRGSVQAGRICGIVATALMGVTLVFVVTLMALAASSS